MRTWQHLHIMPTLCTYAKQLQEYIKTLIPALIYTDDSHINSQLAAIQSNKTTQNRDIQTTTSDKQTLN